MTARASIGWRVAGLFLAGAVIAGIPSSALAGFLSDHTGHAVFGLGDPRGDGHVSFAVYENSGGDWISALGLSGEGTVQQLISSYPVIGDAPYVYFYQIVNTDPLPAGSGPDRPLSGMVVRGAGTATSVGYLKDMVFNDVGTSDANLHIEQGPVNGTNVSLGNPVSTPDTQDDGAPSASGFQFAQNPFRPFVGGTGAKRPDSGQFDCTDLRFWFRNLSAHNLGDFSIAAGGHSSILFFTSNVAPTYQFSILEDSADTQADLPSPAPEPVPLAGLAVVGVPLLVRWTRRMRREGTGRACSCFQPPAR